jgi:predicted XRE-type DNA-binding protein
MVKKKTETVETGSGDVLVDLGFADASERKLRVELAMRLNELIAGRRLTQAAVAQLFGIPQPHVSELKHYKLSRFSSERLLRFVTLLDRDIEIVIRPKAKDHIAGVVSVSVALTTAPLAPRRTSHRGAEGTSA